MLRHHCLVSFFMLGTLSLGVVLADDLRKWSDASGKYEIEAKFIALEGNKVILEKADGSRIQIELSKLKGEDRLEAMKLSRTKDSDNPFKDANAKPGSTRTRPGMRNAPGKNEPTADPGAPPEATIDWTGLKLLAVFGSEWKAPAISAVDTKLTWQPRPLVLPRKDIFDKVTAILPVPAQKRAVVVSTQDKHGTAGSGTVFLCDLEKGRVIKQFTFNSKLTALAISSDGTQLIVRQDVWPPSNSSKLELWKISDSELKREKSWEAAQDEKAHGRDVLGAAFLPDGKTFLTWQGSGMTTWWDAGEVKPLQAIQLQGGCTPALSPDGKLLIGKSNNDLVVLDTATGDTLAVKPLGSGFPFHRMAFSPDGKRLACLSPGKAEIYDLETANLTHTLSVASFGHESACYWTSPTALVAGSPPCFLAPDMNVNVWAYNGVDRLAVLGDQALVLTSDHQKFPIVPVKLPHAAALQLLEQAKKDPNFFVVKPGTRINIDVSGVADPALQRDIADALNRKLKDQGFNVGSGGVTLLASLNKSKDHEIAYRSFGLPSFGRAEKTHTVPGWTYQLKIIADGRTHWQLSGGNHPPMMIHLKQDETIEQHLKQYGTPSSAFFKHLELPKYVARAQTDQVGGSASLRQSQITSNGIR